MNQIIEPVDLTALERDERVDALKPHFASALKQESAFNRLNSEAQQKVQSVLESLGTMRFKSRKDFEDVARALLEPIASDLGRYISVALDNAAGKVRKDHGVLVIYTGGTIGSAPKDL